MTPEKHICATPQDTFELAVRLGKTLKGGDVILLSGKLGAGKTLFAKGILDALGYDIDEVTSPSFTLVNLYETENRRVYHIDFWRLDEGTDVASAVGLDEILEDEGAVVMIEWPEKLLRRSFHGRTFSVKISGDGDDTRRIEIKIESSSTDRMSLPIS